MNPRTGGSFNQLPVVAFRRSAGSWTLRLPVAVISRLIHKNFIGKQPAFLFFGGVPGREPVDRHSGYP